MQIASKPVLFLLLSLLPVLSEALGQTIYVDQSATGANNGSAWADAWTDVQDALAASSSGNEIWVAQGIYTPAAPGGSTTVSFALKNGVGLYGGFAGSETSLDQRDPIANPTTLSGDLNQDDDAGGTHWDNSQHVLTATGLNSTAVLDGFVITASWAAGFTVGGGLYIVNGSPTIGNCTFTGNEATFGGGLGNSGGAPTITGCTFEANSADNGGGVGNTSGGTMNLIDCMFVGNTVDEGGGGMYSVGTANLTHCRFYGNRANGVRGGGGVCSWQYSYLVLDTCLFSGNFTGGSGGAVMSYFGYSVSATNSTFSMNTAVNAAGGAYILGALAVSNCVFWGNRDGFPGVGERDQLTGVGFTIDYSCVEAWSGSWGGTGNHGSDPLFVNAVGADGVAGTLDDDARLGAGSPCIDAGDNTAVTAGVTTDLDGNDRFYDDPATPDTGNGTAPMVDIGPYEFGGAAPSPWTDLGNALAGTHGLPSLVGNGALTGGDPVSLTLSGALENSPAALVIGLTETNLPFKGGVLVPMLDYLIAGLPTDPSGNLALNATWPTGLPSAFETFYQIWITDPAGPQGFSASNAVKGTTP